MKRMLWNLAKRAFRRCFLEDVDAVLLAAYQKRLIDTLALHELAAEFKYGSSVISGRATYAGETRGVFHGGRAAVVLLAIACCAPAYAADLEVKPEPIVHVKYTSFTRLLRTQGENTRPLVGASMLVTANLQLGLRAAFEVEASAAQDGGAVNVSLEDPNTFQVLRLTGALSREVYRGISLAAAYGIAIPYANGSRVVLEKYPKTILAGVRYGSDKHWLYLGGGKHEESGDGFKFLARGQLHIKGPASVGAAMAFGRGSYYTTDVIAGF